MKKILIVDDKMNQNGSSYINEWKSKVPDDLVELVDFSDNISDYFQFDSTNKLVANSFLDEYEYIFIHNSYNRKDIDYSVLDSINLLYSDMIIRFSGGIPNPVFLEKISIRGTDTFIRRFDRKNLERNFSRFLSNSKKLNKWHLISAYYVNVNRYLAELIIDNIIREDIQNIISSEEFKDLLILNNINNSSEEYFEFTHVKDKIEFRNKLDKLL